MSASHDSNALAEVAAKLEIRDLAARYARGADHHDGAAVAALFVPDGVLEVQHVEGPSRRLEGREAITRAVSSLVRYARTTHFLGQHLIDLQGDRATGEVYCQAHHLYRTGEGRLNRTVWIRYFDGYVHRDGRWWFSTRRLHADWSEIRPSPFERGSVPPPAR